MVLDRIFPKITGFYLDGSPSEAEIVYSDKVRRVHIRLGGQEEQITAGPEGVIYITKGYPSALQIKWALKFQKKKFLPYFKFFEAASLAYPEVSSRLTKQDSEFVHHSALEGRYSVRYRIVRSSRRKNTQIAYEGGLLVVRCPTKRTSKWNLSFRNQQRKLFNFWRRCAAVLRLWKKSPLRPKQRTAFGLQTVQKSKLFGSPGNARAFQFLCPTQSSCW